MNQEQLSQILIQQQQLLLEEMKNNLLSKKLKDEFDGNNKKIKSKPLFTAPFSNVEDPYKDYSYHYSNKVNDVLKDGVHSLHVNYDDNRNIDSSKPLLDQNPFEKLHNIGMLTPPGSAPSGISRRLVFF
jgi:hypothetical protein